MTFSINIRIGTKTVKAYCNPKDTILTWDEALGWTSKHNYNLSSSQRSRVRRLTRLKNIGAENENRHYT